MAVSNRTAGITLAAIVAAGAGGAIPLVKHFEGKENIAYADIIGVPTICYGSTGGVHFGQTATDEECDRMLAADLADAVATVERCAPVPMPDNVKAAMVSFAYNVGPGRAGVKDGFCVLKSGSKPRHVRLLAAGDFTGACNMLMSWKKAGGVVVKGLVRRRTAEREVCLGGGGRA